jgi:hypothetical protein
MWTQGRGNKRKKVKNYIMRRIINYMLNEIERSNKREERLAVWEV